MFSKFDYVHMQNARNWAKLSHAKRKKVGAVLVKDGRCISHGYNGRHASQDNKCEDNNGKTRSDVIHAELNAILFAAKYGISTNETILYVTCTPCRNCVPMIASAGVKKIVYAENYISQSQGTNEIDVIKSYGIEIFQLLGE